MNLFDQRWRFGDLKQNYYNMIWADPCWQYKNYSAAGEAKNATAHYDCQDLEWIKDLPVSSLAADDCLLWLWATNPMLPEALETMAAWGFKFKTAGTWCKRTKYKKDNFGTGYIFRSSNEPILIGTRGKPQTTRSVRGTVSSGEELSDFGFTIEAAIREHSRKPEEAFAAAQALMPNAKRAELFSRQRREGWDVWGNELDKFEGIKNGDNE